MLGFADVWTALGFLLTLASVVGCILYGILKAIEVI